MPTHLNKLFNNVFYLWRPFRLDPKERDAGFPVFEMLIYRLGRNG
jgi:hypothetical protein